MTTMTTMTTTGKRVRASMVGILYACLLAPLFSGCQPVATRPATAASAASRIDEYGTMRYLQPGEIRVVRRPDGLLAVQVEVVNLTTGPQTMMYRWKWLDDNGFQVWEDETWKPLLIQGRERKMIQTLAPTPQAAEFRIEMHSPDNTIPVEFSSGRE
jgi:hypothetical protein